MWLDIINALLVIINIPLLIVLLFWLILMILPRKHEGKINFEPNVSVLIATYNEAEHIEKCISAICGTYPSDKFEIIVIDDKSPDGTGKLARKAGAKVITTDHVGKVGSLNEGLKHARGDIIITLDGDTILPKNGIRKIVSKFKDENVGVVDGTVKMRGNGILERYQKIEFYIVSNLLKAHSDYGIPIPFLAGQVAGFRRNVLEKIGGFQTGTISEDTDTYLSIIEQRYTSKVAKIDAYTETISTIGDFIKQRSRWMMGGLQVAVKHMKDLQMNTLYPISSLGLWATTLATSITLNAFAFSYWFQQTPTKIIYTLRWISFIGVPLGIIDLPKWGMPIAATLGITMGLISLLLIVVGMIKENDYDPINWLLVVFFPLYGWILMGSIGMIALVNFIKNPNKTFNSNS